MAPHYKVMGHPSVSCAKMTEPLVRCSAGAA